MRQCIRCGREEGPGCRFGPGRKVCYSCRDMHRRSGATPALRELMQRGPDRRVGEPMVLVDKYLVDSMKVFPARQEMPSSSQQPTSRQDWSQLMQALRNGPVSMLDLANRLDLSPARCEALVDKARADGVQVHLENGHAGMSPSREADIRDIARPKVPRVTQSAMVAVISDTHLGSKYCLRDQLKDFVHRVYEAGVRQILHPGDILDGDYRHGKFEMSHMGLDEQARDWAETLPELPGLTYHAITGNHDYTFTEAAGISVGAVLSSVRKDFFCYGDRGAFLELHGAIIHLWHPRSGGAYATSYPLQKRVEGYAGGEKPHILLAGHWHRYCHIYERGVHAIACPTFQAGGSAFSKSLVGSPAVGGLLLEWGLTKDGTMRDFKHTFVAYHQHEQPRKVEL